MYFLDSEIAWDFLKGDGKVVDNLRRIDKDYGLHITSISAAQLLAKANKDEEKIIVENFLKNIEVVDFGGKHAKAASYALGRGKMNELDLLNAAITRNHNFILITRDVKKYVGFDVKLEEWK